MVEQDPQVATGEAVTPVRYPHEIHISIAPPDNPRLFLRVCEEAGVRPCVFDNECANGAHITDYLTASDYQMTTPEAMREMRRLSNFFIEKGLSVVREKIETSPANPLTPTLKDKASGNRQAPHPNSYFETHFDIHAVRHDWLKRLGLVQFMGPEYPVLLSINRRKPDEFLGTFRMYNVYYEEYMTSFIQAQAKLSEQFEVETADTEFAVFDSNAQHDKVWYDSYKRMVADV